MSLRHTLRTLLNGPQTQEPAGQYGYAPNQQQPPPSLPPSQPQSHYGAPQYGQSHPPFGYPQGQALPQPQFQAPPQAQIHNPIPQGPPVHANPYAPPPHQHHAVPLAAQTQQPYAGAGYPQPHFQQPAMNYTPAPHQAPFDHTAKPTPMNQHFQPPAIGGYNNINNNTHFGGPQNPHVYQPQFSAPPVQQAQPQTQAQPQAFPSQFPPLSPGAPSIQGQPQGPHITSNLHYVPPSAAPAANSNTHPQQTPGTPQFAPQNSPIKPISHEQFSQNQYAPPPSFSQPSTVPNSPFLPNGQRISSPIPQTPTFPPPPSTFSESNVNPNLNYQPAPPPYAPVSAEDPSQRLPQQPLRQSSFGTENKSAMPGPTLQEEPLGQPQQPSQQPPQQSPQQSPQQPPQTPSHKPSENLASTSDLSSTAHSSIQAASPLTSDLPLDTPSGIIHPSMLKQWSRTNTLNSGKLSNPPAVQSAETSNPPSAQSTKTSDAPPVQTQPSPKPPSPKPPSPKFFSSGLPPHSAYPGGKGHRPQASVSRSFTFAKKNADGSPNWSGILLTIDGVAAETLTRFIDGMYNLAGKEEDPLGLTPDQIRVLFEQLDISDDKNHPKRLRLVAEKMNHSDPVAFVNTNLIQCYTIFDLTYITEPNLMPIVTREGFQQYIISQVLIDPSAMHTKFNRYLANHGHELIDPPTKKPFGRIEIDRNCFPAAPNDQYVAREKKQNEALLAIEAANNNDGSPPGNQGGFKHQSSWGI
ncbi:hypothetical protein TWF694_010030 [Orbilia ellipsospora]|uniref:Uncharacterized protein n=1 Tax=Orbilia ellipsospora TaxID=2528407 RepID=A0AAV9X8Q3_9PEZI